MWTKKELQTQDLSEGPSGEPAPRTRLVPDERIEIIHKVATSREERDRLTAELESQGFTVMVRETSAPPVEGESYSATLLAEKRETVTVDTWAVEEEAHRQKKRERKIDIAAKLGFWAAIVLALIGLLYLLGPLIRAVRALF
jgi:hypothetical protein